LGNASVLINNAGISTFCSFDNLSKQLWDKILSVNLGGVFLCTHQLLASLRQTEGSVINIASTRAIQSEPGNEAYSASKGGILALTHALANSLGPQIRVNAISPGWIETCQWQKKSAQTQVNHSQADKLQHPCGRVGEPNDIVQMALFLAKKENGFITGQNFVIDGGMTKKMIYV
jgi:NAD(P)-dependent dehydrogenase (short-subunit alcohol dehydrogenase family)